MICISFKNVFLLLFFFIASQQLLNIPEKNLYINQIENFLKLIRRCNFNADYNIKLYILFAISFNIEYTYVHGLRSINIFMSAIAKRGKDIVNTIFNHKK
jgi:hypothetical protein